MAAPTRQPLARSALLFTCFLNLLSLHTNALSISPSLHLQRIQSRHHDSYCLFAKKKIKSAKQAKTSGFGGKAIEPCPCGSGLVYMKCCGKLHNDSAAFAKATPEQIVRARYSAYAKRQIDFIIASTHPLNSNFMSDIEHWKKTIEMNCYDNFELTSCEIINASQQNDDKATVQFVANMIQRDSREKTAFMETSTFERAGEHIRDGAWLYKSGEIQDPPERQERGKRE